MYNHYLNIAHILFDYVNLNNEILYDNINKQYAKKKRRNRIKPMLNQRSQTQRIHIVCFYYIQLKNENKNNQIIIRW